VTDIQAKSLLELCDDLAARRLSAVELVQALVNRIEAIDQSGPTIRSIIEVNPEALDIATRLDALPAERRRSLHGIPILLKDNIDTADEMNTTAGSLALLGSRPRKDSFVARRLRDAGAILLGKANMSEWANFRSRRSSSGWSARGGQALNPHVLDRTPCGSSSGSASAVAAGLAPVSLGTETNGSILCPGAYNGVVGIKPSVGLTSRSGVVPIAHSQDTVGPFGRSVADAAVILDIIATPDPADAATRDHPERSSYREALDSDALKGARIGVPRKRYFGYSPHSDAAAEWAITVMRDAGATIVDPADIPSVDEMSKLSIDVLYYEFKADLATYLATRPEAKGFPRTLADVIRFNEENCDREMPFFGQDLLLTSEEKGPTTTASYLEVLEKQRRLAGPEGIDAVLDAHNLDALCMPTAGPATLIDLINGDHHLGGCSTPAALAGYPAITVPSGLANGLPLGMTFMGRKWSEAKLIGLAYAFEQLTKRFTTPRFLETVDIDLAPPR
jgi:amidase